MSSDHDVSFAQVCQELLGVVNVPVMDEGGEAPVEKDDRDIGVGVHERDNTETGALSCRIALERDF